MNSQHLRASTCNERDVEGSIHRSAVKRVQNDMFAKLVAYSAHFLRGVRWPENKITSFFTQI